MNKKTLELLLTNYTNINNQLRMPCAEKSKFEKLIKDIELKKLSKTTLKTFFILKIYLPSFTKKLFYKLKYWEFN